MLVVEILSDNMLPHCFAQLTLSPTVTTVFDWELRGKEPPMLRGTTVRGGLWPTK